MSIKSFFSNFFKPEPTIKFKCLDGAFNIGTPVQEARRIIPTFMKNQVNSYKENRFSRCPGMFDIAQAGYIITAHKDIHIKANKQGCIVKIEGYPPGSKYASQNMDHLLIEGLVNFESTVKPLVIKVPLPWGIFCKPGYSAFVIPATMHSEFLDKVYVYPGTVDYDKFHNVNFIFSVIKECEFTIWAGTPILQAIPIKREEFTAECGKANENETDIYNFSFFSRQKNFYRKMFHSKKSYKMKQV